MRVIRIDDINRLPSIKEKCVAAHGYFDGIHLGHQHLIKKTIKIANVKGLKSSIITFYPNPHLLFTNFYQDNSFMEVTPLSQKVKLFEDMGIDIVFVVNLFNFKDIDVKSYIDDFIVKINIGHLVIGYDNAFGKNGEGNINTIGQLVDGKLEHTVCEPYLFEEEKVSTTRVKEFITNGDFENANKLLGRSFKVSGTVFEGRQLGRTLGFPTANIFLGDDQYRPGRGVFASYAYVNGCKYEAMTNVGVNPTVCDDNNIKIEVHFIDQDIDLYGKKVTVEFISKIREEKRFEKLEELKKQLNIDESIIKSLLRT